ncbi:hypothetical protein [Flexivirga endophytica]|nr:hypothetical protein [Flexivirga endophytica]
MTALLTAALACVAFCAPAVHLEQQAPPTTIPGVFNNAADIATADVIAN